MSYISSDGTNMVIVNNAPSASINLQTSNVSNVISTRVDVNETQTEIKNKLKTSLGIIGPTTSLSYTSDMIGYTISKFGTRADFDVSGSNLIVCVQNTGETISRCMDGDSLFNNGEYHLRGYIAFFNNRNVNK